jgi:hypothetical protein
VSRSGGHHRKKHPKKWVKRTDEKRTCPSGKQGYAKPGEAKAIRSDLNVYRCPDCKRYHLADPVTPRMRRAIARGELDKRR